MSEAFYIAGILNFEKTFGGDAEIVSLEKESYQLYHVKIYQINSERDGHRFAFAGSDELPSDGDRLIIDASVYDEVFNGELDSKNPEELFELFNQKLHPLYRGYSMSVSDVVVTEDGAFFCDSSDFKSVDFDAAKTQKPANLMRIVYVEPGKPAYETEILYTLSSMQKAVCGGFIEQIMIENNCAYIGNDEAKLLGMKGNRHYGNGGIIAGPFFICGCCGCEYRSLTDDEVKYFLEKFAEPEDISDEETQADTGFTIYTF